MIIPRQVFPIAACVAKESTRYAIQGVYLERLDPTENGHNARAVTTDGRMLLAASWKDDDDAPLKDWTTVVGLADWEAARKAIPRKRLKGQDHVRVKECEKPPPQVGGGPAPMELCFTGPIGWTLTAAAVDGHFPVYRDVIPKYGEAHGDPFTHEAARSGFNPDLLWKLLGAIRKMVGPDDCGVRCAFSMPVDPTKPLLIEAHDNVLTVQGVLMPINRSE